MTAILNITAPDTDTGVLRRSDTRDALTETLLAYPQAGHVDLTDMTAFLAEARRHRDLLADALAPLRYRNDLLGALARHSITLRTTPAHVTDADRHTVVAQLTGAWYGLALLLDPDLEQAVAAAAQHASRR